MKPLIYQTPRNGELLKTLPIVKAAPYKPKAIFELVIPQINAGDILSIHATGEVTNSTGTNVMFAHYLSLTANGTEIFISPKRGKNVTPSEHHWDWTDVGDWLSTVSATNATLRLYAYCASSAYKSGMTIKVESGQGQMSCLLFNA